VSTGHQSVTEHRVTYVMYGETGWLDFVCAEDARRFIAWGSETGAFIEADLDA
jgi:hypothetical protein